MQTFLPYADFAESAASLDRARLGKQRVETLQLLGALLVPGKGWSNHPAAKMWAEHIPALYEYQEAICHEWTSVRGYKDTCLYKSLMVIEEFGPFEFNRMHSRETEYPWFVGDEDFHLAHQSNLIRKAPEHYIPIFGNVPDDLEYIWEKPLRTA